MNEPLQLVALSGSLRRASYSTALLVANVDRKIDATGYLHDQGTRTYLRVYPEHVERWMRRFHRSERI